MHCDTCGCDSGPTLFCHVCDNFLPDPFVGPKAGLVRRWLAVTLDYVLGITVISVTILSLTRGAAAGSSTVRLLSCVGVLVYATAFFSALAMGMTPGKWILSTRAVDKRNGSTPGIGKMLVRETVGKFVSQISFGLGFFWAIWDRDGQAWHDKLAGTVVVRRDENVSRSYPSAKWPATALLAFALAILSLWIPIVRKATPTEAEATLTSRPVLTSQSDTAPTSFPSPSPSQVELITPESSDEQAVVGALNQESDDRPASEASIKDQPVVDQPAIVQTLDRWASAIEENDPTKTASCYGENVQRYFRARNLSREQVLADREAQAASGRRIIRFQLSDLQFEDVTPSSAKISLTKSYEVEDSGTAPIDRKTHSRLWLTKTELGWKITGEQDLFD